MKTFTKLALGAAAIALAACSSSTSSSDEATESESFPAVIDEAKQTITVYISKDSARCVQKDVSDSTSLTWETYETKNDTTTMQYSFISDTLLIRTMDKYGDYSSSADVFVGGKNGSIQGIWTSVDSCYSLGSKISCKYEFPKKYSVILKISGSRVQSTVKYGNSQDYDFVNTDVTSYILYFIEGYSSSRIYIDEIYTSENFGSKYGDDIQILNVSKTDVSFIYEGKNYKISYSGFVDTFNEEFDYTVSVSGDGQKTCKLTAASREVTKDLCKVSNYDNLDFETEYNDDDDDESSSNKDFMEALNNYVSRYTYVAESYSTSNVKEFDSCLREWNSLPGPSDDDDDWIYSKKIDAASAKIKAERKALKAAFEALR